MVRVGEKKDMYSMFLFICYFVLFKMEETPASIEDVSASEDLVTAQGSNIYQQVAENQLNSGRIARVYKQKAKIPMNPTPLYVFFVLRSFYVE